MTASLVMTAIGPDRPGLVNLVSDVASRHGASWAASRMASLAGQFAGMVQLEVPEENAGALERELRELGSADLQVVVRRSARAGLPAPVRLVRLELVGHDRPGIVRELSGNLARCGVSIDELETAVVSGAMSGGHLFKVKAVLAVPGSLADAELRRALEALANEMMVDLDAQ